MTYLAMVLVFLSTFMHAGWNLLARKYRSEEVFFGRMLALIALIGLVPTIWSEIAVQSITPKAWLCVMGSGFFCGLYLHFLARSYRSADFTTVYPLVRALPVLLVGAGDVLRGMPPTSVGWIGLFLISAGCILSPAYPFRVPSFRSYFTKGNLMILVTALCTVGYTLLDKMASEVILQGPATAARYGYVYLAIAFVTYSISLRIFRIEGEGRDKNSIGWPILLLAACFNFGAYWLVLWAYQLSQHDSYVLSFRQFSIVIGVIIAFAVYKESGKLVRFTAVSFIAAGLILIGFFGG
jgi:drug/metabolite transporter (DMT)-like permease